MPDEHGSKNQLRRVPCEKSGQSMGEPTADAGSSEDASRLSSQRLQAQKIEALGIVANGLAHEFKNILQAILINAELASDVITLESPEREYLDHIIQAAQSGRNLVRQINLFGLRWKSPREPVVAYPVVQNTLHAFRSTLREDITYREWLKDHTARIPVDPSQLASIVANVCRNAAQAMPSGRGFLGVSLKLAPIAEPTPALVADLKPGTYLQLTVKDSGCGIDPEIEAWIFDPFFTTKQSWDGLGLGLAVVYAAVNAAQGSIIVQSRIGKGSTFKVFFPLAPEVHVASEASSPAPRIEADKSILLVDDDTADLQGIHQLLIGLGYRVSSTRDPQDALGMFQNAPDGYALLITDQLMPRMRGSELAGAIHAIRADMPVIICSGSQAALEGLQERQSDIETFLSKPFSDDQLRRALAKLLK